MIDLIKYLSIYFYTIFIKYKIKPETVSTVFLGTGTGVIANVMFVLTTTTDFQIFNLTISFVLAIILLLIGSLERKDK